MHNQIKTSAFILLISSFSALHILEENIRMQRYMVIQGTFKSKATQGQVWKDALGISTTQSCKWTRLTANSEFYFFFSNLDSFYFFF